MIKKISTILVSIATLSACDVSLNSNSRSLTRESGPSNRPTFVLVHGALFSSSGWSRLQGQIQARGFNVATLDVPGRNGDGLNPKTITINSAAEKVCQVIKLQTGPVVLVGHSQGGAVITQAASDCGEQVKGLVYVAAVVPKNKQTAFASLNPDRDIAFGLCVEPDASSGIFKLKRTGPLEESFFQDLRTVDSELADQSLAAMVSEPMGIGTTPLNFDEAKLSVIPKFYVEATKDRIISLETQRTMQSNMKFEKVYTLDAGYSPFLSKPTEVADALVDAIQKR